MDRCEPVDAAAIDEDGRFSSHLFHWSIFGVIEWGTLRIDMRSRVRSDRNVASSFRLVRDKNVVNRLLDHRCRKARDFLKCMVFQFILLFS
jgi:hypothetical protein